MPKVVNSPVIVEAAVDLVVVAKVVVVGLLVIVVVVRPSGANSLKQKSFEMSPKPWIN